MGRWHPPNPTTSPYISPEGYAALVAELDSLWPRRNTVKGHLAAAAAEGDRSENAEYIYRKKELREIDRRIRYLQKRLPTLKVVNRPKASERIYFGAWVTLESAHSDPVEYRIVGSDELAGSGCISVDSPMARALLGKTINDEIHVQTPQGEALYRVVRLRY